MTRLFCGSWSAEIPDVTPAPPTPAPTAQPRRTNHHTCHAIACDARCPPEMLFCRRHWALCPKAQQNAVWAAYRRGQCDDMRITGRYYLAQRDAVYTVAVLEGRMTRAEYDAKMLRARELAERCGTSGRAILTDPAVEL